MDVFPSVYNKRILNKRKMKCPEESTNVEIQQVFAKIKKIPRISEAIRKKKKSLEKQKNIHIIQYFLGL